MILKYIFEYILQLFSQLFFCVNINHYSNIIAGEPV